MEYNQVLEYLYSRLPMFQRVGAVAFKKDLGNTYALLKALGDPHKAFPSVHVAGTNGKGSVSSMLASILKEAGYTTGLYTSPHLRSFTERIRINGAEIPEARVVDFVERMRPAIEEIGPSFFEATVAMAFDHFRHEQVDIAVVEVGMGGRLDSTNVLNPEVCAITNISMDHAQYLGDTLAAIAGEKAGIIKPGVPVVIGQRHPETAQVFVDTALSREAPIHFVEDEVWVERIERSLSGQVFVVRTASGPWLERVELDLAGDYQIENLGTALQAVLRLRECGWDIPDDAILRGLAQVRANSGLKGRMMVLGHQPLTLADVGHNEAGLRFVMNQISQLPYHELHFVLGVVNDKDLDKMIPMLPAHAHYYFVRPDVPRGLDATVLAEAATAQGRLGKVYASVQAGLEAARQAAGPQDLVFVGGSTFVVAEVV